MSEIGFRGVKGRTFDDQMRALQAGYASVADMAIDELGLMVLELMKRVERLESVKPLRFVATSGVPPHDVEED